MQHFETSLHESCEMENEKLKKPNSFCDQVHETWSTTCEDELTSDASLFSENQQS